MTLQPSQAALDLIRQFEGCAQKRPDGSYQAYPDPGTHGPPWTIGWGTTGPDVHQGTVWTQQQCDARLQSDVAAFAGHVAALVGSAPTTQHQFDAMVDFAYNLGIGNLASSTLLKKHKAGDYAGAAQEFGKWCKAAGRVMPGLVKRRAAEAALYSS